ncbi:MAG: diacylglycerol O-acyltransferase / wax synthase, partial [Mycobacterium sp.]|nr:diacylglycerol O-acyltransferase / wax synthase [Mycobacterium sp.]
MAPTDAIFLLGESREHPLHVGGLQLYEPPQGAGPDFVREFYDSLMARQDCQPTFCKRPSTFLGGFASLGWTYDKSVDIDYHVRRSA